MDPHFPLSAVCLLPCIARGPWAVVKDPAASGLRSPGKHRYRRLLGLERGSNLPFPSLPILWDSSL